jgi:integrase/recombinase XerD
MDYSCPRCSKRYDSDAGFRKTKSGHRSLWCKTCMSEPLSMAVQDNDLRTDAPLYHTEKRKLPPLPAISPDHMMQFEEFLTERQYLLNVSADTLAWYRRALRRLPSANPTAADLKSVTMEMRKRGNNASGCNGVAQAINAYLHWKSGAEDKCGSGCKQHLRMARMIETKRVMPTFSTDAIHRLVSYEPKPAVQKDRRLHLLTLLLLDIGCRISEALDIRVGDVDFDASVIVLNGKGRKQRKVPFSFALRKAIYRFVKDFRLQPDSFLFVTANGRPIMRRNSLRSIQRHCLKLGFKPPERTQHAFRHTFAINYLRRGGSEFRLQKVLGHSTLEMTQHYSSVALSDLQEIHEDISLLNG